MSADKKVGRHHLAFEEGHKRETRKSYKKYLQEIIGQSAKEDSEGDLQLDGMDSDGSARRSKRTPVPKKSFDLIENYETKSGTSSKKIKAKRISFPDSENHISSISASTVENDTDDPASALEASSPVQIPNMMHSRSSGKRRTPITPGEERVPVVAVSKSPLPSSIESKVSATMQALLKIRASKQMAQPETTPDKTSTSGKGETPQKSASVKVNDGHVASDDDVVSSKSSNKSPKSQRKSSLTKRAITQTTPEQVASKRGRKRKSALDSVDASKTPDETPKANRDSVLEAAGELATVQSRKRKRSSIVPSISIKQEQEDEELVSPKTYESYVTCVSKVRQPDEVPSNVSSSKKRDSGGRRSSLSEPAKSVTERLIIKLPAKTFDASPMKKKRKLQDSAPVLVESHVEGARKRGRRSSVSGCEKPEGNQRAVGTAQDSGSPRKEKISIKKKKTKDACLESVSVAINSTPKKSKKKAAKSSSPRSHQKLERHEKLGNNIATREGTVPYSGPVSALVDECMQSQSFASPELEQGSLGVAVAKREDFSDSAEYQGNAGDGLLVRKAEVATDIAVSERLSIEEKPTKRKAEKKYQNVVDVQCFDADDVEVVRIKKKKIYKKKRGEKILVKIVRNHLNKSGVVVKAETVAVQEAGHPEHPSDVTLMKDTPEVHLHTYPCLSEGSIASESKGDAESSAAPSKKRSEGARLKTDGSPSKSAAKQRKVVRPANKNVTVRGKIVGKTTKGMKKTGLAAYENDDDEEDLDILASPSKPVVTPRKADIHPTVRKKLQRLSRLSPSSWTEQEFAIIKKAVSDTDEFEIPRYSSSRLEPVDIAAHMQLLGESLNVIAVALEQQSSMTVHGALSVMLDSVLCALAPLACLTSLIPEMKSIDVDTQARTLDNVAYILPGL